MFRHRIFGLNLVLVAALLAAPMSLLSPTPARAEEEKKQKSELHKKMEVIDEGMKKLKRTLKKADQNEASLKIVANIVELAKSCKEMTPSQAAKLPMPASCVSAAPLSVNSSTRYRTSTPRSRRAAAKASCSSCARATHGKIFGQVAVDGTSARCHSPFLSVSHSEVPRRESMGAIPPAHQ